MSDGTGTDNMTCIIVQFRDPEDVKAEKEEEE
jgi:serine/threonine protein phosphatase PrpC